MTSIATKVELVLEGGFFAEVAVEIFKDDLGWSPGLTPAAIEKLDALRLALRAGDVAAASRLAKVYTAKLIAG